MATGKAVRMNRIKGADGKILMVSMDQAAVAGPVGRLRDPQEAVLSAVEGAPDCLLLTRGTLGQGWRAIPAGLGLIMRISGGFTILEGAREFRDRLISGVEDALRWGADGVAVTVKFGHELEGEFIQKVSEVADACDRWGVPLLIEALVTLRSSAGLSEEEALAVAARAAAELGADLVQLPYPAKGGRLSEAVKGCPVPVVVGEGEKAGEGETAEIARRALEDGAAGVAVGRSLWGMDDPQALLRELGAMMGRSGT